MPPEVLNKAHEAIKSEPDKTIEILANALTVASVGIAALRTLESFLPVAARDVEEASKKLTTHFLSLAQGINKNQAPDDLKEHISGITTHMQFQDRNTQLTENAVTILERYRTLLEDAKQSIRALCDNDTINEESVKIAVDSILSGVRLSDIHNFFTEALLKEGIEHVIKREQDKRLAPGDVDLF